MNQDLEANKSNAIAFYKAAFEGSPREAVGKYVGSEYIQHNPLVGNGPEPFIEYFERMASEYPGKSIEFVRQLQRATWWRFTLTKYGPVVMNT